MSLAGAPESAVEPVTNGHHSTANAFDLQSYISRYAAGSETRLQRLAFIASITSDENMKKRALQLLENQLLESSNVIRYNQVTPNPDTAWVRSTCQKNEATLDVLEARLSAAQANLNKDAIRVCYLNLATFHTKTGQLREALRNILRARDYCTNRAQTSQICWKVIEIAMNLENYNQVRDYVAKAEHSIVAGDTDTARKLKVVAGCSLLGDGQYKEACQKFHQVKIPPETMGELVSAEDFALYSSLLALATMDRSQLSHYLEDYSTVLELVPTMRDALRAHVRAEYKQCLALVQSQPLLQYDVLLAPHACSILNQIRNRSFVDYLQPYSKVHLPHMAQTFGETVETVEKSLSFLIGSGDIQHARMDLRTLTLQRDSPIKMEKARLAKTETRVQHLQESVLNDAYASIVRLACLEHEPAPERGGASFAHAFGSNPEDSLADLDDSDDDDDVVDMVYDMVNPDDI